MQPAALALIQSGTAKKGGVLGVASITAIQAAKKTSDLIPLCHRLALTRVAIEFEVSETESEITCEKKAAAKVGSGAASDQFGTGIIRLHTAGKANTSKTSKSSVA